MILSDSEKTAVDSLLEKVGPKAPELGCEALDRLFKDHPETKSHFGNMDLTPGSKDLHAHGEKVINAIIEASKNQGNLVEHLSSLRDLHTNKLKLSVDTIKLLSNHILEVFLKHFPDADRAACDKFLNAVADNLISS